MIAPILFAAYLLLALIISLLAIGSQGLDDEETPIGFAIAGGLLWLPIICCVVLIAGAAALLKERA